MFVCGPKYVSERLKLECVYKTYALANGERIREVQHEMLNTTHNSVNISPTEIILVYK